jgi:hypothetical protein
MSMYGAPVRGSGETFTAPGTSRRISATFCGKLLNLAEITAEYLHPDLSANAGREHFDSVDDRLCPNVLHAGHQESCIHLFKQASPALVQGAIDSAAANE